jgi:hypothetical protein
MALTVPESDMHSHDRTLISRLGFADPDKGDRRHDLACQFLASRGVAESIGCQFIRPKAEDLFCRERSFHSDYSSSNVPDVVRSGSLDERCNFHVSHEVPISKGEGKYATTIGFLDLSICYTVSYTAREDRRGKIQEFHLSDDLYAFFEIKVKPIPVGDAIRQIRFYRLHAHGGHHPAWWFLVTAFPFSEADGAMLAASKIHHIQLGSKFEEWASIQEASAPAKPAMEL